MTGDKIVESTANAAHGIYGSIPVTTGTTYTFSAYVKYAGRYIQLATGGGFVANGYANFDLINGVVTAYGAGATSYGITPVGNGWYRVTLTVPTFITGSGNPNIIPINSPTAGAAASYTGDGYSGVYVWGAQLEAGSFATSYIATTSSSVTRNADVGTMPVGNSWYNYNQGTQYIESQNLYNATQFAGTGAAFYTAYRNNVFMLQARRDALSYPSQNLVIQSNGVLYTPTSGTINNNGNPNLYYKYAGAMQSGNSNMTMDGAAPNLSSTTFTFAPPTPTTLGFGVDPYAYGTFCGHISKFAYYPKRLSDAELQEMTE